MGLLYRTVRTAQHRIDFAKNLWASKLQTNPQNAAVIDSSNDAKKRQTKCWNTDTRTKCQLGWTFLAHEGYTIACLSKFFAPEHCLPQILHRSISIARSVRGIIVQHCKFFKSLHCLYGNDSISIESSIFHRCKNGHEQAMGSLAWHCFPAPGATH